MTLTEYIATLGANDWSVSKGSLTEGQLTVTYHVQNGEENPHTEGVGTEISGEGWHYRLTNVTESEDPNGNGYNVTQTWGDIKGILNKIPCFVKKNLPPAALRAVVLALRYGYTAMVSAQDLLTAAANAAARAGYSIDVGTISGECMVPWSNSNMTIGQVIDYVAQWVPNLTTRSSGTTLEVVGGYVRLDTGTAATASVACTPNMKTGTLTVGSTVVDLAAVYAKNAAQLEPLNWYSHYAGLIASELAFCKEASVLAVGNTLYLTARERGAAGNDIPLELEGVEAVDGVAHATLYHAEDLTMAGTLSDGENEVELEALEAVDAKAEFTPWESYESSMAYEFSVLENGVKVNGWAWNAQDGDTVHELLAALNDDSGEIWLYTRDIEATLEDGKIVLRRTGVHGAASNGYVIQPWANTPFKESAPTPIEGGEDAERTIDDLVEAINAEDAFEFTAGMQGGTVAQGGWLYVADYSYGGTFTLKHGDEVVYSHTFEARSPGDPYTLESIVQELEDDGWPFELYGTPENNEIDFQAKEAGEWWNTELFLEGEMFSTGSGTSGGEDGDRITLTANEAGSGGNDLNARADGCFGRAGAFSGGTDASTREAVVTAFHGGEDGEEPEPYNGLLGQRPSGAAVPTWPISSRTRETSESNQQCSCVVGVANGNVVFTYPEGANPYSVGALIVEVNFTSDEGTGNDSTDTEMAPIREAIKQANTEREKDQPWNYVRGNPVPKGWQVATPGMKMTVAVGNPEAWKAFWCQFGFATLKRINGVKGIAFGRAAFFPVPADEAYPPDPEDEDKGIGGGTLGPAIKENGNAPANYRILTPSDNMHVLVSGSFPACSRARGNVGGLRFCHGTLKQYVWTTGGASGITPEEGMEFFEGTCKVGGRMRRYVCLSVKAVWINRRKKRYQNGTNRLAPSDPDYNEDKDRGKGWFRIGEEEEETPPSASLSKADYVEAARELWESSRNCGGDGTGESIQLHAVRNFNADLSVDDVFAKLGLATANGTMTYNAGAHTLEVNSTASQRDALGFEDYLLRIQARKQAEVIEWRERNKEKEDPTPRDPDDPQPPTPPPTPQQVDEENEKRSYPMVNPSISPNHGVTGNGRPLDPFEVYADDGKWYMNEGTIPHEPPINFPTTEITNIHAPNRAYFVKPYYDRTTHQWKAVARWRPR